MNPTAIYSKSGKGVQEASGKTSLLKRPDRAVLSAIDGRATLAEVAQKVGRPNDNAFRALIQQLDREGFIREVTSGSAVATPSRPAPPSRPAAPASRPADPASDLDFSSLGATKIGGVAPARPAAPPSRPAAPPSRPAGPPSRPAPPPSRPPEPPRAPPSPQQSQQAKAQMSALDKAREEAEAKAAAERERLRKEAEDKARTELEAKMRADAEKKMKEEAEARAKAAAAAEAEAKVKAAREAAARAAAEAKAKAEAEAKAKLEAERKAREEMERRLEEERKAREEAERKAREEEQRAREQAERARREAEEKARREAEELRQRLEAERKAKEEAERLRREAEAQARAAREEAERKAKEEAERMRRELEAERRRLEEQRRQAEEAAAQAAAAQEAAAAQAAAAQAAQAAAAAQAQAAAAQAQPPSPRAEAKPGSFADSLMADLESFTNKDEEEQKTRAAAEQEAKAEAERRRREEEAQRQEEARRQEEEARERAAAEARRREDEEARRREEEERLAREEERRRREAEEIQRKAEAATAAAMARQAAGAEDDIPISDDDLDMTEVKKERKALGIDEKKLKEKDAQRAARKRRRAEEKKRRQAEKAAAKAATVVAPSGVRRRSSSWGRPVALLLAIVLVAALGAAHFVALDPAPYEQAATQALGEPVRIGSARLWLLSGIEIRLENVRAGEARIVRVHAHPTIGALFGGEPKRFSLIELEGVSMPQAAFGEALFSRMKTDRFAVERIKARELRLAGSLALPPLEADVQLDARGGLRTATLYGPDGLTVHAVPKGEALELEATAAGFPLPIAPGIVLSDFAMKGTATQHGLDIAEWGGALFNGGISGTARLRWGSRWDLDGALTVRNINAAVFAPALLSQGTAEGTGRFSMSAADPTKLIGTARFEGRFAIGKGTLGSFDLSRAIQTRGKQSTGTTHFAELNGQVVYERGMVALRNVSIGAGALNAGASAEIGKGGVLSGRIVADMQTAAQTLSATLLLGGTVKEPQVHD